jgi:hypothetical protein
VRYGIEYAAADRGGCKRFGRDGGSGLRGGDLALIGHDFSHAARQRNDAGLQPLRVVFKAANTMTRQKYPPRIMYIESKDNTLNGAARIGRVTFTRTGATLRYKNQEFQSLDGNGFKANYFEVGRGTEYWISGPRRDGADRLYGYGLPVEIDEDVREEYWTKIRKEPSLKNRNTTYLAKRIERTWQP